MENKYYLKGNTAELVNHIFQTLLVTYLILLLLEQIWSGFVSVYINLNYLLIGVIIAGVLDVFSSPPPKKEKKKNKWYDYAFIILLGILGFGIILLKTKDSLDLWLSILISFIASLLIILLSILIISQDENSIIQPQRKRNLSKNHLLLLIALIFILLFILAFNIAIFSSLNLFSSLRIIFGSIFVLFIPGFVLTFVFFPYSIEKDSIDLLERIALSFALSIAVVPLAVFYFNLIGVKINVLNSSLIILGIIITGLVLIYLKSKKSSKYHKY